MLKIEKDFEAAYPGQLQELRAMALIACWLQARHDNAESEHYSFFAMSEKLSLMNKFYNDYPMGDEYKIDLD